MSRRTISRSRIGNRVTTETTTLKLTASYDRAAKLGFRGCRVSIGHPDGFVAKLAVGYTLTPRHDNRFDSGANAGALSQTLRVG